MLVTTTWGFSISNDKGECLLEVIKVQINFYSKYVWKLDFEGHALVDEAMLTKAQHDSRFDNRCDDIRSFCKDYKALGYCTKYAKMRRDCPKTCGFC